MNNLTVIMYHYIRDLKHSRFPEIKGLDKKAFAGQIAYLNKHYHFVTMEEVIHSIDTKDKLSPKSVLLTFDDAYSDHFSNVLPILDEYQVQGSFYAPVKAIIEHTVLDVNKIHFILASQVNTQEIIQEIKVWLLANKKQYMLKDFEFYYKKLAHKGRYDDKNIIFVKRLLQVELDEKIRMRLVDELFVKYVGISEDAFSRELYMDTKQLKMLLRCGMHVGSHGFNHYWWNHLNENALELEIDKSMNFLKEIGVDMSQWTACYPYGSYDEKAVEMLNEKKCKLAVTTEGRIANLDKDHRQLIPRLDTNDFPTTIEGNR